MMPFEYVVPRIPTLSEIGGMTASDDEALAREIKHVLSLMTPQRALSAAKARFGRSHDGGYVHLDDFTDVDIALSFGINDDVSWDLEMATRGIHVHQFDHTVDDPRPDDDRMSFNKAKVVAWPEPGAVTLASLIAKYDRKLDRPNMVLKTDIEAHEWAVIESTNQAQIRRFAQIVGEFHAFENIAIPHWRQEFYRTLRKLHLFYAPIHVHANNYAGYSVIAGVPVPYVLEVTWANRALWQFEPSTEVFPTALDLPCNAAAPDHHLGTFRF
jgi:hypothetical protein